MKKRQTKSMDEQYLGPEPTWEDQDTLDEAQFKSKYANALNWYNYFSDRAGAKSVVLKYLQLSEEENKDAIEAVKKVPDWMITNTVASICKMRLRGLTRTPVRDRDTKDWLKEQFDELVEKASKVVEEKAEKKEEKPTNVVSIQQKMHDAACRASEEIEDAIEALRENKWKLDFDTYAYLRRNQVKGLIAKRILDFYAKEADELEEALTGKCEQLTEGYSHFTKADLKNYAKSMRTICDDITRWIDNQKTTRKPRAKKPKPIEKQIANVKYLKQFDELKLVSVSPAKVVGAMVVWVYNVKYKKLGKYVASTRSGFSFKGTTLQGFDENQSIQKTLRKPEEALQKCLTGGKIIHRKLLGELTTKEQQLNGRFNEETIILKVTDL